MEHVLNGALEHHFAAAATSLGADVDDVVGGEHHVFVVLDDNDGVADVAQLLETGDEFVVVALMKTDAGFVEDIEHVDELRTDLGGEADTLALAAGEGG